MLENEKARGAQGSEQQGSGQRGGGTPRPGSRAATSRRLEARRPASRTVALAESSGYEPGRKRLNNRRSDVRVGTQLIWELVEE
jgi:hypothetical protein